MSQKEVSVKNQKNNPPKKEANGDTDSNLMKEKGYVHDAKRPFNYDNNNLFFHADENYIIGNKNLNSLFMGQNFQNDYSENMEQLNNNEKKPKPVINNYNNINIPGRKINKANSKKVPKVNNFSNINIGPDIINIKKTNPEPSSNKDNKTRNGPLILKNDPSEIDSSDRFKKEITPLNAPNLNKNKTIKIKPDDSSEKSCTNYSNKKSLLSNRDNNSLNGKIPELNKENYDDDIKKACDEIGEENMKINMADYETASKTDSREFCSFYFNQLKHRQIFFYTAYFHKYAENVFMKIMIAIFHILLCLFLNVFWYRTFYVHSEFISPINNHSTFSSKYAWFRILLSVLFYIIIIGLLHLIYLPQLRIYYSLSNDKLDNNQKLEIMEKNVKCMKINYIIFIVFNFCFLIVLLLYILVFSYVFQNSKTDLMISFILTVVITQALPFIFVFFVTVFRFIGLKCNIPCFYNFSLIFTI
jgi:ribosomal protein S8